MKSLPNLKMMSLKRLLRVNFLFLTILLSLNIFAEDGRAIYKYALEKVVRIDIPDGHGTGFILTNDLLMTNHHVVDDVKNSDIKVKFANGKTLKDVVVLYKNEAEDIAILSADIDKPGFEIAQKYEAGEKIFVLGNPSRYDFTFTDGLISKITKDKFDVENLQFTAPALGGSSGSPILNSEGKLVGILKEGLTSTQGFNFGTSVFNINKALKHTIFLNDNIDKLEQGCTTDGESCHLLGTLMRKSSFSEQALKYFKLGCSNDWQPACVSKLIIEHSLNSIDLSELRFQLKKICQDHKTDEACKFSSIFEEELVVKDNLIPLLDIEIKLPYEFELVNPIYSKISGDEFLKSLSSIDSLKYLGWVENKSLYPDKKGRTYILIEEFEITNDHKEFMKGLKLKQLAEAAIKLIKEEDKYGEIDQIKISKIKNKEPYLFSIDILEKTGIRKKEVHIYGDRKTALKIQIMTPTKLKDAIDLAENILIKSITQKSSGGVIEFDKGRYLRRLGFTIPVIMVFFLGIHLFMKKRRNKKLLSQVSA